MSHKLVKVDTNTKTIKGTIFSFFQPIYILPAILFFTFISRVINIWYPTGYVFDEVYHAFTAKQYLIGSKAAWEYWTTPPPGVAYEWTHPPVAKEIMTISMWLLHTTQAWAYRIPGVLFGVAAVYLVYLIAKKLFNNETIALISAFLFSLDGLTFVQSRTGMNDIYMVAFTLAAVYFFLKDKFIISAVFFGLAIASKWTGFFLYPYLFILIAIIHFKDKTIRLYLTVLTALGILYVLIFKSATIFSVLHLTSLVGNANNFVSQFVTFMLQPSTHAVLLIIVAIYIALFPKFRIIGWFLLIPPLIYLLSYMPFFLLGHTYKQFTDLQQQMWWYHTGLKATHDYSSPWWSWPFNLYPVWYFVDYHTNGTISNIFASGNPLLYLLGDVAIIVSIWQLIKKRSYSLFVVVLGFLIFWLPWALSPRIMFLYHYCPSIPFLSIALGYQTYKYANDGKDKVLLAVIIGAILIAFLLLYPMLTGIPLPRNLMLLFFHTNVTKNPFGWS